MDRWRRRFICMARGHAYPQADVVKGKAVCPRCDMVFRDRYSS